MDDFKEPNFESESSPEELEEMSRLWVMRYNQEDFNIVPLTAEENEKLDNFLKTADTETVARVERIAHMRVEYFWYMDKNLPEDKRQEIDREMAKDGELREYVESSYAKLLAEEYSMWRYEIENSEEMRSEMNEYEIRKFFEYMEKYPDVVDESLISMTSQATLTPERKIEINPDETAFLTERQKLFNLRDYLVGELGSRARDKFNNELIDDVRFRQMFLKIKKALTANKK